MRSSTVVLASVLLLSGCAGWGGKRIERYSFVAPKEAASNQKTGAVISGETVKLIDAQGKPVAIKEFRGKPLVLVFMRGFAGYICPYCTTYTAQIATRYPEIKQAGAEVLVVYPCRKKDKGKVKEFVKVVNEILEEDGKEAIPFPVFLDPGARAVEHYNLLGDLSKPSTFVLDAQGKITYVYVGRDRADRPSVDRIVQEVKALAGAGKKK